MRTRNDRIKSWRRQFDTLSPELRREFTWWLMCMNDPDRMTRWIASTVDRNRFRKQPNRTNDGGGICSSSGTTYSENHQRARGIRGFLVGPSLSVASTDTVNPHLEPPAAAIDGDRPRMATHRAVLDVGAGGLRIDVEVDPFCAVRTFHARGFFHNCQYTSDHEKARARSSARAR